MKHDIDLIIFDCDGVVIDSEIISANVLIDELFPYGINIDIDYVQQHFLGCNFQSVKQKIKSNLQVQLPDSFEARYHQVLLTAFETQLTTTEGFKAFLASLTIPFCIATSSSKKRTDKALDIVGLTDFFNKNNIFTADEVENGKPAPDLFLHAAKQMQVNKQHCLVIEDSFFGGSAAKNANMSVVHYVGGKHLPDGTNIVSSVFSDVPVLDNWRKFSELVPAVVTINNSFTLNKSNDN
ncbi:HAD family hydrolase [Shewanella japonica]|uniref:HAD family hydrolase n=1 Tax=Shewanella japonica TaxID=93973 RepID=UPI002495044D|nr:HAD family hydrolase [Shewanella japonica]